MIRKSGEDRMLGDVLFPEFKEHVHLINDGKRTANSGGKQKDSRRCLSCGSLFPSMSSANRRCAKCTLKLDRRSLGVLGEDMIQWN